MEKSTNVCVLRDLSEIDYWLIKTVCRGIILILLLDRVGAKITLTNASERNQKYSHKWVDMFFTIIMLFSIFLSFSFSFTFLFASQKHNPPPHPNKNGQVCLAEKEPSCPTNNNNQSNTIYRTFQKYCCYRNYRRVFSSMPPPTSTIV